MIITKKQIIVLLDTIKDNKVISNFVNGTLSTTWFIIERDIPDSVELEVKE